MQINEGAGFPKPVLTAYRLVKRYQDSEFGLGYRPISCFSPDAEWSPQIINAASSDQIGLEEKRGDFDSREAIQMIGEHNPKTARNTSLVEAITIGLDEAFTALEEAFYDLNDEQIQSFPIRGRNNIAWILMHALQNLDTYANAFQTGERAFAHEDRWDLWRCSEDKRPKPGDPFPSKKEMMDTLRAVRVAAMEGIAIARESDLLGSRMAEGWWGQRTSADAYMRTIYHAMAHVRQIWLLRGALGMTDGKSWPRQHWA